jgi:hypothetical protein
MRAEDLPGQVGWHMTHFGTPNRYAVRTGPAPKEVETVINHRVINRVHVVAGVSGGVTVRTGELLEGGAIKVGRFVALEEGRREGKTPDNLPPGAWWWD